MDGFTPSQFGGGWIKARTEAESEILADWFGEDPMPLAPLGCALGWIVEPYQVADLADLLSANV